ncbi:TadE-like protein [Planctomycetes bacterium K23_9]|uniref:TadE-like protein n=2 Tax=Stieleria marina TaxID=1930275 RepID=A0A517NQ49_9BACT|nr:TadE-like protein [Planctomycetes bacterium K23_9]
MLTYGNQNRRTLRNSASQPPTSRRSARMGAAVVELAVCIPILVIVVVATTDACTMFHVQQNLKVAAYEGARVGIVPQAEAENVSYQCESLLDAQGVNGFSIAMEPSDPGTLKAGDYFTVTISADFKDNALVGGLFADKTLTRSVTLRAE